MALKANYAFCVDVSNVLLWTALFGADEIQS